MNLKAWFKSNTADRVLSPLRELIIDFMDENSNVLEVGCGTGDLLFRAASKIRFGLGVDLDQHMIDFANERKQKEKCENLDFVSEDIRSLNNFGERRFDLSTSTLCIHEMREEDAISTLELLAKHSSRVIIADFGMPQTRWTKISIEFDEFISGHYSRFRHYRKIGGLPQLAKMAGLKIDGRTETPIDGIQIWHIGSSKHP